MSKILIAGPCSAESPEQMMHAAAMISLINDQAILRAGCWKPRTNPGMFEGFGSEALVWMKQAAQNYGLDWITECGTSHHAEDILRAEGNLLWIGARTTGDPFAVEEIASALAGTDVEVWIKNPPQPDLKLWLGAAERFSRRGIHVKGFIHRGFKIWPGGTLRNAPCWSVLRELKKEVRGIPLICDPSHIAGKKSGVISLAMQSAEQEVDGWMIETHPDPSVAMTDKEQQLSPAELLHLLNQLTRVNGATQLRRIRNEIDELDTSLWSILRERVRCTQEIAAYKAEKSIDVVQSDRMKQVMRNYIRHSSTAGIDASSAKELFRIIHAASVKVQREVNRLPATPAL